MSDAYIVRRGKIIQGGGGGNMQSKTVTPTASGFTVTPDSGYDGLSSVIVNGDTDLKASNIKNGINIFGVTGSYGGGGGFDPNGAVLKAVTSTGCSVAVTGTGYSQTHQNSDGFPRSDDANVTEHFFSIPASAFGTITVTAINVYGTNTETITVDTAGKVYELLISAPNIILNSTFGLQDGYTLDTAYWTYNDRYKLITSTIAISPGGRPLFENEYNAIPISSYSKLTAKAYATSSTYNKIYLKDSDGVTLCTLTFPTSQDYTVTEDITGKYYPTAGLFSSCSQISEIILS